MEIRFTLTKPDWDWAIPVLMREAPSMQRQWLHYKRQARVLIPGQMIFAAGYAIAAYSLFKAGEVFVGWLCVYIGIILIWSIFAQWRRRSWEMHSQFSLRDNADLTESVWSSPCVLTVDERGIHSQREHRELRFGWPLVAWIAAQPEGVLIGTKDGHPFIVPLRALEMSGGPGGFKAFVERLWMNGGGQLPGQ